MNWEERMVIDSGILVGKRVTRGTRLSVEFIIDPFAQGWPEEDILRNYPGFAHANIQACLSYASDILRAEKVYPTKV